MVSTLLGTCIHSYWVQLAYIYVKAVCKFLTWEICIGMQKFLVHLNKRGVQNVNTMCILYRNWCMHSVIYWYNYLM